MYILGNMWKETLNEDGSKLFNYEDDYISAEIKSSNLGAEMEWEVISKKSFEKVNGRSTNWIDANFAVDAFVKMVIAYCSNSARLPSCPRCNSRIGYDLYDADISVKSNYQGASVRVGIQGDSVIDFGEEHKKEALRISDVAGKIRCINCDSLIDDKEFIGKVIGSTRD